MKIISKYKDFYDFIAQDHSADLVYVRNIGLVNENLDDMFRKKGNAISFFSKQYGYADDYYLRNHKNGDLTFNNFIFGIYPFVYSQPILRIYYKYKPSNTISSKFVILGTGLVNKLLDSNKDISKNAFEHELLPLAQAEFDELANSSLCDSTKVSFNFNNKFDKEILQKSLKMYVWKIDCKDIFYKIQSPVFTKYVHKLFVNGAYSDSWPKEPKFGKSKDTYYVTDISFQKLNYNIIKYWYGELFDINTYINIENFLWSIRQEPTTTPDNNTKILAHGFDLKTSFRKM